MKRNFLFLIMLGFITSCKMISIPENEKKQIIAELNDIKTIDQKFAGIPPKLLIDTYGNDQAWQIFKKQRDSVGIVNQEKIKKLYEKYGYLGYNEVGEKASKDFWITIQHADNDIEFQKEMLNELRKEVAKDNASKAEYAMLEDRINVHSHKKQHFGTQVTYNQFGQAFAKIGLVDSVNIETLRKEYELPSLINYYNKMTIKHFQMNKNNLITRGITEPKLYDSPVE